MSRSIHVLPDSISNKIAAGEVVEDPSSCIKELIENAIDAGATKITVEVMGGGLTSIKVVDNGHGMGSEDAKLCLLRHATSKIASAEDLFGITTMGFRGEALSSIASISKMTITTAREGGKGIQLDIESGRIVGEKEIARSCGTTVHVCSLFYSVPARKAFQKSPAALSATIFKLMTTLGLAHPNVQLQLLSNGKEVVATNKAQSVKGKIASVLGDEVVRRGYFMEKELGGVSLRGYISSPLDTKPNRSGQWLFLNNRPVICNEIREAIYAAYGTRLQERRHPLFVLYVTLSPDAVDVNVHPQKLQVRLKNPEEVARAIEQSVHASFTVNKSVFVPPAAPVSYNFSVPSITFSETLQEEQALELHWTSDDFYPRFLYGPYLFIEEDARLLIVDLQKAKTRLVFDELVRGNKGGIEKQGLLLPIHVELDQIETAMVLTHQAAISQMGFSLTFLGNLSFSIDAIPLFITENKVREVLVAMGQSLQEFIGQEDYEQRRQRTLAQTALRFAKTAKVSTLEMGEKMYRQLLQSSEPHRCPNGHPIIGSVDHATIEMVIQKNSKTATDIAEQRI